MALRLSMHLYRLPPPLLNSHYRKDRYACILFPFKFLANDFICGGDIDFFVKMEEKISSQLLSVAPSLRKLTFCDAGAVGYSIISSLTDYGYDDLIGIICEVAMGVRSRKSTSPGKDVCTPDLATAHTTVLYASCAIGTYILKRLQCECIAEEARVRSMFICLYLPLLANAQQLEPTEVSEVRNAARDVIITSKHWNLASEIVIYCGIRNEDQRKTFDRNSVCIVPLDGSTQFEDAESEAENNNWAGKTDRRDDTSLSRSSMEFLQSSEAIHLSAELIEVALELISSQQKVVELYNSIESKSKGDGAAWSHSDSPVDLIHFVTSSKTREVLSFVAESASTIEKNAYNDQAVAQARYLLPACLAASKVAGNLGENLAVMWKTFRALGMSSKSGEKHAGLALIVQFHEALIDQGMVLDDEEFWHVLLQSLDSADALNRKRAQYVLETAIQCKNNRSNIHSNALSGPSKTAGVSESSGSCITSVSFKTWSIFLKLYTAVEETALHLFKETWPLIDAIHLPEITSQSAERASFETAVQHEGIDSSVEDRGPLSMPLDWTLFLWKKALAAKHMTAQKIAVSSFFKRSWPDFVLSQVPPRFVSVLADALSVPGVVKGDMSTEIDEAYPGFFRRWTMALTAAHQQELICLILDVMENPTKRPDTLSKFAATALSSVASGASVINEEEFLLKVLFKSRNIAKRYHGYGSNSISLLIYSSLIRLVTSLASTAVSAAVLGRLGSMLSPLPLPLVQPGGQVYAPLYEWAVGIPWSQSGPERVVEGKNTSHGATKLVENDSEVAFDDCSTSMERSGLAALIKQLVDDYVNVHVLSTILRTEDKNRDKFSSYCDEDGLSRVLIVFADALCVEDLEAVFAYLLFVLLEDPCDEEEKARRLESSLTFILSLLKAISPMPSGGNLSTPENRHDESRNCSKDVICRTLSTSVLKQWILYHLGRHQLFIKAMLCLTNRRMHALVSASRPDELKSLAEHCLEQCTKRSISTGDGFNLDKVLPDSFLKMRNAACNSLECISGLLKVMAEAMQTVLHPYGDREARQRDHCGGEGSSAMIHVSSNGPTEDLSHTSLHRQNHEIILSTVVHHLHEAMRAYRSMWDGFDMTAVPLASDGRSIKERPLMSLRARLEVGYSLLRPFVACSEAFDMALNYMKARSRENDRDIYVDRKELCSFLSALLRVLAQQQTRFQRMDHDPNQLQMVQNLKFNESSAKLAKRKVKKGSKKPSLTLESWHYLTAWRSLDALLSMTGECIYLPSSNDSDAMNPSRTESIDTGRNLMYTMEINAMEELSAASVAGTVPVDLVAELSVIAAISIKTSSESSCTPLISCIRCIRALIPRYFIRRGDLDGALVDAVVASARRNGLVLQDSNGDASSMEATILWLGSILLDAFIEQSRGRTGLGAAILTTILHPSWFDLSSTEQDGGTRCQLKKLHIPGGALHTIVCRLADSITSHARLMALFSSHFSAILIAFPHVAMHYVDVICSIATFGVDDDGRLASLTDVTLDIPSARELSNVLPFLQPFMLSSYAGTAAAPRVAMLCLLSSWVTEIRSSAERGNATHAKGFIMETLQRVWREIFDKALNDPVLSTEKYLHFGPTHRKKLRAWQALTALCPVVPPAQAQETLQHMITLLGRTNAASVKQYQEIVTLQMTVLNPMLLWEEILPRVSDYSNQRYEAMPSLIAVALQCALDIYLRVQNTSRDEVTNCLEACEASLTPEGSATTMTIPENLDAALVNLKKVVSTIVPWTMSFNHGNRTFTQLLVWRLIEICPDVTKDNPALQSMGIFFSQNRDLHRLRASFGIEQALDRFDVHVATSLPSILCDNVGLLGSHAYSHSSSPGSPETLENAPQSLMDALNAYLKRQRVALRSQVQRMMQQNVREDEERRLRVMMEKQRNHLNDTNVGDVRGESKHPENVASATSRAFERSGKLEPHEEQYWQRKYAPTDKEAAVVDPWGAALGLSVLSAIGQQRRRAPDNDHPGTVPMDEYEIQHCCSALRAALQAHEEAGGTRQDLIVVASLIDRIPNLAGLARTCEVFRAARLVLADASVVKDSEFSHISVSAEHWVPIEEVSRESLSAWLRRKSIEGYALVGLEQTAGSVRLSEFVFPRRTVLLLGAEKEGVPADLLDVLDVAVEIPQLGVVRSLNVHVSAACAIYEFTRQGLV